MVELGCGRKPGGTGPDHGDLLAGPPIWGLGYQPSLLERPLRDRHLDLLDRHGLVVDREHARGLARGRADPPRELREVVGHVELIGRLAPLVPVDEVVPVRDQVPQRAALMAERDPAVHAAGALAAELLLALQPEVLLVVADPPARVSLVEADPVDLEKRA